MQRTRSQLRKSQRGAAMVEFALVVPIFITMLLWSMYFTEIVRMRLKLQEAARYTAFEMTSYALTDFETGNSDDAYDRASKSVLDDAKDRFKDFDSVEDNAKAPFFIGYDAFNTTMTNEDVPVINENIAPSSGGVGGFANAIAGFINKGLGGILGFWKFNMKGRVYVETQGDLIQPFIPKNYNDQGVGLWQKVDSWGGKDLTRKTYKSRFTLVANGWNLNDGTDARVKQSGQGRAGVRTKDDGEGEHSMHKQVNRMTYAGLGQVIGNIPGLSALPGVLQIAFPSLLPPNAFVVSKNYDESTGSTNRNCNVPSYPTNQNGLQNVADKDGNEDGEYEGPGLDQDRLRCFDTAPFRDQHATMDSLYIKVWQARGNHFMGCKKAQATDPTTTTDPNTGDKASRLDCG